jgi:hypothetical protein
MAFHASREPVIEGPDPQGLMPRLREHLPASGDGREIRPAS